jgi:hypothetical protein
VSSLFIFGNSLSGLAGLLLARQPSGALLPALPSQLGWMLLMVMLLAAAKLLGIAG